MATGAQIVTSVTIINSLLGYNGVSLTDYSTSALTTIAAGSKLEIGGAFFHWATAETPVASSWTAIATASTAYLKCTPSGSAGTQISTARWTADVPVWSTSKQGWYASAASVARVVASAYKTSATQQDKKRLLLGKQAFGIDERLTIHADGAIDSDSTITADGGIVAGAGNATLLKKVVNIGDWDMDANPEVNIAHGLTFSKIRSVSGLIRNDADNKYYQIPSPKYTDGTGDEMGVWVASVDATNVILHREGTSQWDDTNFNATSFNRGWVIIEYTP